MSEADHSMLVASALNVVWTLVGLAVIAGLGWLALRIDPHWASRDGKRFTCKVQPIRLSGHIEGRFRDARATIEGDDLILNIRGMGQRPDPFLRYRVTGRADTPPSGKEVFTVSGTTPAGEDLLYALRVPADSRAVAQLNEIIRRP